LAAANFRGLWPLMSIFDPVAPPPCDHGPLRQLPAQRERGRQQASLDDWDQRYSGSGTVDFRRK